jgi:hypothetical protein
MPVLNGKTGATIWTINGQAAGDNFGWAVTGLGDINDDGHDDVAIGAPRNDTAGADAGRVYIISGKTKSSLQKINGEQAGDRFGSSVAGRTFPAGLIFTYLAVGAPRSNSGGTDSGSAYLYSEDHSGANTNNCSSLLCVIDIVDGESIGDRFGTSVALGDVGGDSVPDLIVGAPFNDENGALAGRAYVLNGNGGAILRIVTGEAAGDRFGKSVAFAGDVDGDGDGDFVIGAPNNDAGGSDAGRAYVFFGN